MPALSEKIPPQPANQIGGRRWLICGLLFFATTVNYMDRQVIGLLKPTLQLQLGWTEVGYSNIVLAFQFAYGAQPPWLTRPRAQYFSSRWRALAWDWARPAVFRQPSKQWRSGFPSGSARWQRVYSIPARTSARS